MRKKCNIISLYELVIIIINNIVISILVLFATIINVKIILSFNIIKVWLPQYNLCWFFLYIFPPYIIIFYFYNIEYYNHNNNNK